MTRLPDERFSMAHKLLGVFLAALLVSAALVAIVLHQLHSQTLAKAEDLTESYARLVEEQTERIFLSTDQSLQLAEVQINKLRVTRQLNEASARATLLSQIKGSPHLESMWVLDASGRIVFDSTPGTLGLNLSDRPFFAAHAAQPALKLFIDVPVLSRRTGQWQFSVSRALRNSQGELEGVMVAALSPRYFEALWRTVDLGEDGSVTLLRRDGTLLMRSPFVESSIGKVLNQRPLFTQYLPAKAIGTYTDHSSIDGTRRIFAYRQLPTTDGLVVVVGTSLLFVLRSWVQVVTVAVSIWLCAAMVTAVLLRYLNLAWRQQRRTSELAAVSQHALSAVSQGVLISGPDRLTLTVNHAFETLTGYTAAELVGRSCAILQGPLTDMATVAQLRDALDRQQAFTCEVINYRKDGSAFWNELSINPVLNSRLELTHFVGVQRDVSARHAQETQDKLTAQVFSQGLEGITVTDAAGVIIKVNRAFTTITGYAEEEVIGKNPRVLASGLQTPDYYKAMWTDIVDKGTWSGEIFNRHKDGTVYPEWLTISAMRDEAGAITNFIGSFSDLTMAKAAENRIQRLSHFDPLTGLPNRALLRDRMANAISHAQRSKEPLCLMLVSIDHFKNINDTLGHHVGDSMLLEIGKRLSEAVRDQDTVSRQSGKEFTLVLPGTSPEGAAFLATELLWKLAQPYQLGGQALAMTASIGLASYPDNGTDFDSLFKSVEIAMHRAQASGRDNFKFYSEDMYNEVLQRDHMTKALRTAAELGELQVVYQPLGDLQTGRVSGMEALLRWHHPSLGAVSPTIFIPIAEESGLIRSIGEWALRQVCKDLRTWLDKCIDVPHVAVNVSPVQFRDPDLMNVVQSALASYGIEPRLVHLEVTESALMDDADRCEATLRGFKALGFSLSLDDFGTGYSSLSYLKRYPFDKVKIDQSFVRDIGNNRADTVLVKVIISMAHGLGLTVIAEGVETEAQCEIMRSNVCDEIQGYFFSRPVDAVALGALLVDPLQLPPHLLRFRKQQRTLLLVDDEPNVLASLKRLFRRDGHAIVVANSGAEGLEVLAKQKVDVIISDQRMPGMTGVEFLREAKLKYPDTIRIVLSGYTELQSVTDAINEGSIYRFLTKPWEDDQLREQINQAFSHKELLEENQQLDIKIRTTNQELVAANRHLGEVIHFNQKQIEAEQISLAVAREALQFVPGPVIGVDDQGLITFVNTAAQDVFTDAYPLLGIELAHAHPTLARVVNEVAEGQLTEVEVEGATHQIQWNTMGKSSKSKGLLITMT